MNTVVRILVACFVLSTPATFADISLAEAAAKGDLATIDRLIAEGAPMIGKFKWALDYAVRKGQFAAVRHLIVTHGAETEPAGFPSPILIQTDDREMAELLTKLGADPDAKWRKHTARKRHPEWPWNEWATAGIEERAEEAARAARERQELAEAKISAASAARFNADAAMPVAIRRDKYMIALSDHLKNEEYDKALPYFRWLKSLDVDLAPAFDFFQGEALLGVGEIDEGIDVLYGYVAKVGTEGEFYLKALELIGEAEAEAY